MRDIADAESHGILQPPPPGAGWAKSTLHKALQLAVRLFLFYFISAHAYPCLPEILLPRRQARLYPLQDSARHETPRPGRWSPARALGVPHVAHAERRHQEVHASPAPLNELPHSTCLRLVPFVLIALILEEIIPLIVIWAPGMLPSTCILPSQRERIQAKAMDQALALAVNHGPALAALTRAADGGEIPLNAISSPDVPKVLCGFVHSSHKIGALTVCECSDSYDFRRAASTRCAYGAYADI